MLKRGSELPVNDHVMRYVSPNRLRRDENHNVIGFLPQAFSLRENETSLSVNWLEYFGQDLKISGKQSVLTFRSSLQLSKSSVFGIARVGKVKELSQRSGKPVRVVYDPTRSNRSHSLIKVVQPEDQALLEAMAVEFWSTNIKNSGV